MLGEDLEVQPMETRDGSAGAAPAQLNGSRGQAQGHNAARKPQEQRTCFYCGKIDHLMRDCKRVQKVKEGEKRDWKLHRRGPMQNKRKVLGNAYVPRQHAAL